MKRKFVSVLFAVVLLTGLSLMPAVPAAAASTTTTLEIPDNVYRLAEFVASSTTTNDGTAYSNVRFNITVDGPVDFTGDRADTFTITKVNGSSETQGINETFVLVDGDFVGYWGPETGFPLIDGYNETSTFTIQMTDGGTAPLGDYEVTVELVDLLDPENPVTLDSATAGFNLSDNTLYVGAGQQFTTIQSAITAASTGDTINVAAGEYVEQVSIGKSLTLQGAGQATTTIKSPASLTKTSWTHDGRDFYPVIEVNGASAHAITVDVSGFTIDGDYNFDVGEPGVKRAFTGIVYRNADGRIESNEIKNFRDEPLSALQYGEGIWVVPDSTVTIAGNNIHDYNKTGVRVSGVEAEATITGNTVIGCGPTDVIAQNGVLLIGGATGTVSNNTVTSHSCILPEYESCGIFIFSAGSGVKVQDNPTLDSNDIGIAVYFTAGVEVSTNNLSNNYETIWAESMDSIAILDNIISDFIKAGMVVKDVLSVQIEGNIISTTSVAEASNGIQIGYIGATTGTTGTVNTNHVSGCHWSGYDPLTETYEDDWTASGILVIDTASALEISGNEVQNCDVGFDVEVGSGTVIANNDVHDNSYGSVSYNANPTINFNDIYQNDLFAVYRTYDLTGTLDATLNWWGDISGPNFGHYSESPVGNPGGTGDNVSGNVDCVPWLTRDFETVLADNIAYFGIPMVYLNTGWNTLSTPIALDAGCDQWDEYVALGDSLSTHPASPAYAFDGDAQNWVPLIGENADYELKPCDAIYVRMNEPDIAAILWSPDVSVASKDLYAGWNLVGLAWLPGEPDGCMDAVEALATVSKVTDDLTGYKLVVSPPVNWQQWFFLRGDWSSEQMCLTEGYWVFMNNPGTLAGFSMTPIPLD